MTALNAPMRLSAVLATAAASRIVPPTRAGHGLSNCSLKERIYQRHCLLSPLSLRFYSQSPRHNLEPAPSPTSGPLLSRRSDRELPSLSSTSPTRTWLRTLPLFILAITFSSLAIFNYQKSSSSVVSSTLYALRVNEKARQILGDEIYFRSKVPWIRGEMNQLKGIIDVAFWVKGTKATGKCRFRSVRRTRMGFVRIFPSMLDVES